MGQSQGKWQASPSPISKKSSCSQHLPLSLEQSYLYPGRAPRPICGSTARTDTGIWQLRPWRTRRAGSWHQGLATCQHTFPSSRAQLLGICQVPAPWVAMAGSKPAAHRPAGWTPPWSWFMWHSLRTVLHELARWVASDQTHIGDFRLAGSHHRVSHFLPKLFFFCFQPPVC